jgi:hypothetical protein
MGIAPVDWEPISLRDQHGAHELLVRRTQFYIALHAFCVVGSLSSRVEKGVWCRVMNSARTCRPLRTEGTARVNPPAQSVGRWSDCFHSNTMPGYQPLLARKAFGTVISMMSLSARRLSAACW